MISVPSLFVPMLLAASAMAAAAPAVENDSDLRCAVKERTAKQIAFSSALAQEGLVAPRSSSNATSLNVDVYLHVVAVSETDGNLSVRSGPGKQLQPDVARAFRLTEDQDDAIKAQMDVLNSNYAPSRISFTVRGVGRTFNATWATGNDTIGMQKALRVGDMSTLNIFFLKSLDDGISAGVATPAYVLFQNESVVDGAHVRSNTLPGNSGPLGLGKTATHEVGHWLGLEHTFNGGCTGPGDGVNDTPAQNSSTEGCPIGQNSCPDRPGVDPVQNYMDYSDDACMAGFTQGQTDRMWRMWFRCRAPGNSCFLGPNEDPERIGPTEPVLDKGKGS